MRPDSDPIARMYLIRKQNKQRWSNITTLKHANFDRFIFEILMIVYETNEENKLKTEKREEEQRFFARPTVSTNLHKPTAKY